MDGGTEGSLKGGVSKTMEGSSFSFVDHWVERGAWVVDAPLCSFRYIKRKIHLFRFRVKLGLLEVTDAQVPRYLGHRDPLPHGV